jgi:hypothetical protein
MQESSTNVRKWCFSGILMLALLVAGTTQGTAFDKFNQSFGVAIQGYDAVAYHTEGHVALRER